MRCNPVSHRSPGFSSEDAAFPSLLYVFSPSPFARFAIHCIFIFIYLKSPFISAPFISVLVVILFPFRYLRFAFFVYFLLTTC